MEKVERRKGWGEILAAEGDSLAAQTVKDPPAKQKTWVQSLGQEDPLDQAEGSSTRCH